MEPETVLCELNYDALTLLTAEHRNNAGYVGRAARMQHWPALYAAGLKRQGQETR